MSVLNTVNVEILAIHLIWRFGDEQLNRQISKPPIFLYTHKFMESAKFRDGPEKKWRHIKSAQMTLSLEMSM